MQLLKISEQFCNYFVPVWDKFIKEEEHHRFLFGICLHGENINEKKKIGVNNSSECHAKMLKLTWAKYQNIAPYMILWSTDNQSNFPASIS